MTYYVFTVNDLKISNEQIISAQDVLKKLLEEKVWLFTNYAPLFRKLEQGDQVLFYICGKNRRYFAAKSTIGGSVLEISLSSELNKLRTTLGISWFDYYVNLSNIFIFDEPIYIKTLIPSLQFIKDKKNYGLNLRLPVIKISENDFKFIIDKNSHIG